MTALKAIEEVGDGDWNDIVNWLKHNGEGCERVFSGLAAGGDIGFEEEEQEDSEIEEEEEESEESADDLPPNKGDHTQSKINRSANIVLLRLISRSVGLSVAWCWPLHIHPAPDQSGCYSQTTH